MRPPVRATRERINYKEIVDAVCNARNSARCKSTARSTTSHPQGVPHHIGGPEDAGSNNHAHNHNNQNQEQEVEIMQDAPQENDASQDQDNRVQEAEQQEQQDQAEGAGVTNNQDLQDNERQDEVIDMQEVEALLHEQDLHRAAKIAELEHRLD
ncbi:hypothetical protein KEM55_007269, partial [Ascosphaera atra]